MMIKREDLEAWLAAQDPNQGYVGDDAQDCLMTRFFRETIPGAVKSATCPSLWEDDGENVHDSGLDPDDVQRIVFLRPWTYGDALERLREDVTHREDVR